MLCPAMGRQLRLEFTNLGTHDVLPMIEHPGDCSINPVANTRLLRGKIDETDRFAGRG